LRVVSKIVNPNCMPAVPYRGFLAIVIGLQ
jgi:hypothetical protein